MNKSTDTEALENHPELKLIRDRMVFVKSASGNGLGFLSDGFIITCTHIHPHLPLGFIETDLFEVERINGGNGDFAMYIATSLDVMLLAQDGWHCGLSEGPTGSAKNVIYAVEGSEESQFPTKIDLASNDECIVDGFFFGKDGTTIHKTQLHLNKHDETIDFYSEFIEAGCSGGPIFTHDFHLLGVVTTQTTPICRHRRAKTNGIGRRIDLSLPEAASRRIQWRRLTF